MAGSPQLGRTSVLLKSGEPHRLVMMGATREIPISDRVSGEISGNPLDIALGMTVEINRARGAAASGQAGDDRGFTIRKSGE